jgi:methionyl-tRNA formyltransferase
LNKNNDVVLITSPVLADEARTLFGNIYPNGSFLVWRQGDDSGKAQIHSELMTGKFSLGISFYNDYIFSAEEIDSIECLVNIHPALPHLPGRGYDVLPLIRGDESYGVTFHFIRKKIDSGEIIDILSEKIPLNTSQQNLRIMNQDLSLKFLKNFLNEYKPVGENIKDILKSKSQKLDCNWSGTFMNSRDLENFIRIHKNANKSNY